MFRILIVQVLQREFIFYMLKVLHQVETELEKSRKVNGQHDSGEIQDEEIKRNMIKVPIKMCQKVSTADDQKVLGILKG